MSKYASETSVTPDRSRAEIEHTLERYGATAFMYAKDQGRVAIAFQMKGRMLRMVLPLPERNADEFRFSPTHKRRTDSSQREAYEQAVRQRWRALVLFDGLSLPWAVGYYSVHPELIEVEPVRREEG